MTENRFAEGFSADRVQIGRSAVSSVNAAMAEIEQSAIQRLSGETVRVTNSAMVAVNGATVELKESAAGVAVADYVRIEDSNVLLLLAPRVSGNVNVAITLPAAFAFGAGFFIANRVFKGVFGRRER